MSDESWIENLSAECIKALLDEGDHILSLEQAEALEDFIDRLGGIQNAQLAIRMLEEIERAA